MSCVTSLKAVKHNGDVMATVKSSTEFIRFDSHHEAESQELLLFMRDFSDAHRIFIVLTKWAAGCFGPACSVTQRPDATTRARDMIWEISFIDT